MNSKRWINWVAATRRKSAHHDCVLKVITREHSFQEANMNYVVKERASGDVLAQGEEGSGARLFEGNLYFAPANVNTAHLKVTERTYTCPYKGVCFWIDLEADGVKAQNVGWVYRNPKPGYEFIKDEIAFYNRETSGTQVVKE
jgi:uncharacterized protein (DUF427 family)